MIVDFVIRHDRDADLVSFDNDPHHGYFVTEDIRNLAYTIMATGDDLNLEDGRLDRGLGRIFYFSSPQTKNGLVLGNNNNDNAGKIRTSRDVIC